MWIRFAQIYRCLLKVEMVKTRDKLSPAEALQATDGFNAARKIISACSNAF